MLMLLTYLASLCIEQIELPAKNSTLFIEDTVNKIRLIRYGQKDTVNKIRLIRYG